MKDVPSLLKVCFPGKKSPGNNKHTIVLNLMQMNTGHFSLLLSARTDM